MFVYYIDIGVVNQMIDISIVELRSLLIIGILGHGIFKDPSSLTSLSSTRWCEFETAATFLRLVGHLDYFFSPIMIKAERLAIRSNLHFQADNQQDAPWPWLWYIVPIFSWSF